MRRVAKAALILQIALTALSGCSNGAGKPAAALLEALDGLGLHKATYGSADLANDGVRLSRVKGTDDAGRPVTIDEILTERPSPSGDGWHAATVTVTGLKGGRLSARIVVLNDVVLSTAAGGAATVGSYRASDVTGTLHGLLVAAREVVHTPSADGGGEVAFAALAAGGDAWDGRLVVAAGPAPGTASITMPSLNSARARIDLAGLFSGVTPRLALSYALSADPVPAPNAVLLQANVEGTAPALPLGLTVPDPTGFKDPPMRALMEALSTMSASGLVGGGIQLSPPGGVPLSDLGAVVRAPDAYARLGVVPLTERMPADVVRKVIPLTTGRDRGDGRPGEMAKPR